jgi:hypothetical protein
MEENIFPFLHEAKLVNEKVWGKQFEDNIGGFEDLDGIFGYNSFSKSIVMS